MKSTIFKRILACTLCLVLVVSMAACGNSGSSAQTEASKAPEAANTATEAPAATEAEIVPQTLKVMWWGNQTRADSTMAMMKEFEASHPGVTVEVEFTDWGGYWDKLSTLAISNNMPDVIQMDISNLAMYAGNGLLTELDSYIAGGAIDLSKCSEGILNTGKIDGVSYAIPTGSNTRAMAYRADVAEQAGVEIPMEPTWDELLEICKTVYEKTGWTHTLGESYFEHTLRNAGLAMFNEAQDALGFDDPAYLVNHWNRYLTGVAEGHELDISKQTRTTEPECFIKDTWVASGWTNQLVNYVADSGDVELKLFQIPEEAGAVAPSNWMQPTMFWAVPSSAKNADLGAEFINWFTNDKTPYDITGVDRGVPINAEMSAYVSGNLDGIVAQGAEFVSWLSTEGKVGEMPIDLNPKAAEVRALFVEVCQSVQLGASKDLEKTATDFMAQANALLAEGAK